VGEARKGESEERMRPGQGKGYLILGVSSQDRFGKRRSQVKAKKRLG